MGDDNKQVEPEIIPVRPTNEYQQSYSSYQNNGKTFFTYSNFKNTGGIGSPSASLITLVLLIFCGFSYGLLAAIGFIFFYAIFSLVSYFIMFNLLMRGINIHPNIFRIANWILCTMLVAWLS